MLSHDTTDACKASRQIALSCENYNREFPRYPRLIEDKGWIHGTWYCGAFYKSKLYGDYPPTFLRRALSLFPDVEDGRILHCPSGSLNGQTRGVTVDLISDDKRRPQIVASADKLPFPDTHSTWFFPILPMVQNIASDMEHRIIL